MTVTENAVAVVPVAGALGAEVTGVDLNRVTDEHFDAIHRALVEHLVLFFSGQSLTIEGHRDFAGRFGELERHPYLPKVDDTVPEVVLLSERERADTWHTDVTFSAHPPIASVFHLIDGPEAGGDTMWTSMEAAYAELSAPMQAFLEGLTATHAAHLFGHPEDTASHPVVRVHPVTGRRCLYVNRTWTHYVNELSREESRALLDYLYTHSEQPQFTVRRRWRPGDVCMWDNRSTMHIAVNDYGAGERTVHRVTVLGDDPQPAGDLTWQAWKPAGFSARTMLPVLKG